MRLSPHSFTQQMEATRFLLNGGHPLTFSAVTPRFPVSPVGFDRASLVPIGEGTHTVKVVSYAGPPRTQNAIMISFVATRVIEIPIATPPAPDLYIDHYAGLVLVDSHLYRSRFSSRKVFCTTNVTSVSVSEWWEIDSPYGLIFLPVGNHTLRVVVQGVLSCGSPICHTAPVTSAEAVERVLISTTSPPPAPRVTSDAVRYPGVYWVSDNWVSDNYPWWFANALTMYVSAEHPLCSLNVTRTNGWFFTWNGSTPSNVTIHLSGPSVLVPPVRVLAEHRAPPSPSLMLDPDGGTFQTRRLWVRLECYEMPTTECFYAVDGGPHHEVDAWYWLQLGPGKHTVEVLSRPRNCVCGCTNTSKIVTYAVGSSSLSECSLPCNVSIIPSASRVFFDTAVFGSANIFQQRQHRLHYRVTCHLSDSGRCPAGAQQ